MFLMMMMVYVLLFTVVYTQAVIKESSCGSCLLGVLSWVGSRVSLLT